MIKHGDGSNGKEHPIYRIWLAMKGRCSRSGNRKHIYLERNIFVCQEWRQNYPAFKTWAINSGWKLGLQIDRINNDDHYRSGNCRWVTPKQNSRNKRNNVRFNFFGELLTTVEAAEKYKVNNTTIRARMFIQKLSPQEAVTIPVRGSYGRDNSLQ